MNHKHPALTLGAIFTSTLFFLISCKKINESTSLGGDLIPAIDNITTFDTILTAEAYNDTFTLLTDTTFYNSSYTNYLGQINNDPLFGKTDAKLFLELKPATYRYTFENRSPDSLNIDSIVLILDYVETYGDSIIPQTVNVYEIPQTSLFGDTAFPIRSSNNNYPKAGLLGTRTFVPTSLNDSIKAYKDTSANQLRIKLDNAFGQRLLEYDTSSAGTKGAYYSDSAFQTFFKGFALESTSGNAIIGINLQGANTKLAIYYRDDNGNSPTEKWDTAVAYFKFAENANSASANYIQRDYTGTPLASAAGGTTPDDLVYIQSTPGSFATIKIPALAGLNNRVVHRAELIMEQVYDTKDTIFYPTNLYLDAYDSSVSKFRTIPYDVSFDNNSGASNVESFGINPINTKDPSGRSINSWRFNLTRYIQHVVNDTEPVYNLRLFAPLFVQELYRPGNNGSEDFLRPFVVNDQVGKGRVRLAGNTGPTDTNPQRMRLRIIYSKI